MRLTKGDTRGLDYSSYSRNGSQEVQLGLFFKKTFGRSAGLK